MLYAEIIAVCSEIRTEHINALRRQSVQFFNSERGGTCSNQWTLMG
jgi:hypothetical protein